MKEHHFTCTLAEVGIEEISEEEKQLIAAAKEALQTAYAPYSDFRVGAAVLLENGKVIIGSNQENAAYPSGLCAERVAVFSAASQFPGEKILAIAVTTANEIKEPVAPCGACRQVMVEYEIKQDKKIRLLLTNPAGKIYISESVENLLPLVFQLRK
ncbi:MAG: cytidine deaminase [Chitinophagales bacterium]